MRTSQCLDADSAELDSHLDTNVPAATAGVADASAVRKKKKKIKKKKKQTGNKAIYDDCTFDTFRITESAGSGRGMVATKNIKAGDSVLDERPFVKVLRTDCALEHCSSCCQKVQHVARIDAGVPYTAYCSRACRDKEGDVRSAEANVLGKLGGISAARDVDLDLLRIVLRLLVMRATALGLRPDDAYSDQGGTGQGAADEDDDDDEELIAVTTYTVLGQQQLPPSSLADLCYQSAFKTVSCFPFTSRQPFDDFFASATERSRAPLEAGLFAVRAEQTLRVLHLEVSNVVGVGVTPVASFDAQFSALRMASGRDDGSKASRDLERQWQGVRSLMHHRDKMDIKWIKVVRAASEDLLQIMPAWARVHVDEAVELACRVNVNAHGLRDDSGSNLVIGLGMFPLMAMMNHNCRPNCTFVYFGGKMEVRALDDIAAGEELSLYYIDLLQTTADRRRELLATKHFLCHCSRCVDPEPADAYLAGVCCIDCGASGCLTSKRPPKPEDLVAAQLEQLTDELNDLTLPVANGTKGRIKKKGGSGGRRTVGAHSQKQCATQSNVLENGLASGAASKSAARASKNGGTGESANRGTDDAVMFCSACGREFSIALVDTAVARAKVLWDSAMSTVRAKDFTRARKPLEKWLEDFDAGYATRPSAAKKKTSKKEGLKLHPANAMVVQTLAPLANCCNFDKDFPSSVRYLRRALSAMEAVCPRNYPELGDFHAALAEAISSMLEQRGEGMAKKTKGLAVIERKHALERAAAIRSICLGAEHPSTRASMSALARF